MEDRERVGCEIVVGNDMDQFAVEPIDNAKGGAAEATARFRIASKTGSVSVGDELITCKISVRRSLQRLVTFGTRLSQLSLQLLGRATRMLICTGGRDVRLHSVHQRGPTDKGHPTLGSPPTIRSPGSSATITSRRSVPGAVVRSSCAVWSVEARKVGAELTTAIVCLSPESVVDWP